MNYLHKVNDLIYDNMELGMQNYNASGYEGVTHTWDVIQHEVKGRDNY